MDIVCTIPVSAKATENIVINNSVIILYQPNKAGKKSIKNKRSERKNLIKINV